MKQHKNHIGLRIKQLREAMGLIQEDFAKLIGITRGKLSQIEIGRTEPDLDVIRNIASKCSVTYEHLIDGATMMMAAEPVMPYGLKVSEIQQLKKMADSLTDLKPILDKIPTKT